MQQRELKRTRRRAAKGTQAAPPSSRRGPTSGASSRRARRSRRRAGVALALFVGAILALVGGLRWLGGRGGPGAGGPIVIEVPPHATARELGRILADAGAVRSASMTSFYLGIFGDPARLVPGPHLLDDAWSLAKIRAALERRPDRDEAKVVIPEGLHHVAIADRLEAARVCSREAFLAAATEPRWLDALEVPGPSGGTPDSAEGFLFPATYQLAVDTPATEIVARLVGEADTRWRRLAKAHAPALARLEQELGWGRREIVTLASMVEKETGAAEERPLVASVFLNRLRDPAFSPKLLQSDPTTGYGCLRARDRAPTCADYAGKVTGAMNRDRLNPYSTYVREGLPPGPIANPGEAAIEAVLAPASSSYLYFVAKGGGRHHFSSTYDEHQRAIRGEAPAP